MNFEGGRNAGVFSVDSEVGRAAREARYHCGYASLGDVLSLMEGFEQGRIKTPKHSAEEKKTIQKHIDFIVQAWNENRYIENYELPDGRVVSLTNKAIGSKKPAILIRSWVMETNYSPTSEGSLRGILTRY